MEQEKNTHTTYYMQGEGREAERDMQGEMGEMVWELEERDGKRSSLGNLFWSTQSADTQGAGKPITV